jgi:hypothetical protein
MVDLLKDMLEGLTASHDASPHGNPEICAIHPVMQYCFPPIESLTPDNQAFMDPILC